MSDIVEQMKTDFAKADIADRVKGVLVNQSGICAENMDDETDLAADLMLDSLDLIETGMKLEEEFEIAIPDCDVDRPELGTVGGLVAYIEGRLA